MSVPAFSIVDDRLLVARAVELATHTTESPWYLVVRLADGGFAVLERDEVLQLDTANDAARLSDLGEFLGALSALTYRVSGTTLPGPFELSAFALTNAQRRIVLVDQSGDVVGVHFQEESGERHADRNSALGSGQSVSQRPPTIHVPGVIVGGVSLGVADLESTENTTGAGLMGGHDRPGWERETAGSPGGDAEAGVAEPPAEEPPKAYAQLDCDETVIAGTEFELAIGLSPTPSRGVIETDDIAIVPPPGTPDEYFLTVHVTAEGFSIRDDERWRHQLAVTPLQSYPTVIVHLIPDAPAGDHTLRVINATYEIGGQVVGAAFRPVVVISNPGIEAPAPPQPGALDVAIPTGEVPPDLTVVLHESEKPGRLWLVMGTPYADDVILPDEKIAVDVGGDAREYARLLIDYMNALEGKPGLWDALIGKGRLLAEQLPEAFWITLHEVADRVRTAEEHWPPTLLLLSDEPYIPWELTAVESERFDHDAPPFLGAQVSMGRWVLKRAQLPPPHELGASAIAVVTGDYSSIPGWPVLDAADDERTELTARYGAVGVDANYADVRAVVNGTPHRDVLHMAIHGRYDEHSVGNGLILADRTVLDSDKVRGLDMTGRPFVFLNACQVGTGSAVLGDYSGIAAEFLNAGASGVIAPLWSVKDDIAKSVALSFYERVFAGSSVGEAVRTARAGFRPPTDPSADAEETGRDPDEAPSATFMAYQYFGHPALRLIR